MPALTTLTLDADGTIGAVLHDAGTGSPYYTHCNDTPDGLSSDYVANNDDASGTYTAWFSLSNVNSDLLQMSMLAITVDVQAVGFSNDTCTLTARIYDADNDTTNALTDETRTLASNADSTRTQRTVRFTGLTGSKTQWDAAHIRLTWTYTRIPGPDGAELRLFGVNLPGQYHKVDQIVYVFQKKLPAAAAGTVDFTCSELGSSYAGPAIVFTGNANVTSSPYDPFPHASLSAGFWDGTNVRSAGWTSDDNVGTSNTQRKQSTGDIATVPSAAAASYSDWTISSITNGIRLTLNTDNTSVERWATVLLFHPDYVTSKAAGTITPNATQNGTQSATIGFQADVILFAGTGSSTTSLEDQAYFSLGAVVDDGSRTQRAICVFGIDNQGTSYTGVRAETNSVGGQIYNDTVLYTLECTSITSTAFELTTRDGATGSDVIYYLAIALANGVSLSTVSTPTSTGTSESNDPAFQVDSLLLCVCNATAIDTDTQGVSVSVAASDGGAGASISVTDEDNQDVTDTSSGAARRIIDVRAMTDGSDYVAATVSSLDSDGFTLNYSAVDGANNLKGWALAFEAQAAPTGRIMSSLADAGGLAGSGGLAGKGGGLAG